MMNEFSEHVKLLSEYHLLAFRMRFTHIHINITERNTYVTAIKLN